MSFKPVPKENCAACGKTVYAMERLGIEGLAFHKPCFRCTECKGQLKAGNYAAVEGKYYCKPHFKQLFRRSGDYSRGFGAANPKDKWNHLDMYGGEKKEDDGSAEPAQTTSSNSLAPPSRFD